MEGFRGNINGKWYGDPLKFLVDAREEAEIDKESIGMIMNFLDTDQLLSGVFTKKELKTLNHDYGFKEVRVNSIKPKLFKLVKEYIKYPHLG